MSLKVKKPREYQWLLDRISREVFDSGHGQGRADIALQHLKDQDTEFIRKVDFADGAWGLEVVQKCWCESFSIDLLQNPPRRLRRQARLQASPVGWRSQNSPTSLADRVVGESPIHNGPPSAQNSTTLARDVFPQLVTENPFQRNWPALARNLKLWHKDGMNWDFMRWMMEEFAKHPEWCRRAKTPPWRVFLARKQELVTMVLHEQQRKARRPERPLTPLPGTTLAGTANHMYERPAQPFARA
jgi:hypothetical protein